jgi:hypothetical protein
VTSFQEASWPRTCRTRTAKLAYNGSAPIRILSLLDPVFETFAVQVRHMLFAIVSLVDSGRIAVELARSVPMFDTLCGKGRRGDPADRAVMDFSCGHQESSKSDVGRRRSERGAVSLSRRTSLHDRRGILAMGSPLTKKLRDSTKGLPPTKSIDRWRPARTWPQSGQPGRGSRAKKTRAPANPEHDVTLIAVGLLPAGWR